MLCPRNNEDVSLKSPVGEIHMLGSVRDIKMLSMVEYCDTLLTERGEKQGIQNIPKGGI